MRISRLTADAALASLRSAPTGLASDGAQAGAGRAPGDGRPAR